MGKNQEYFISKFCPFFLLIEQVISINLPIAIPIHLSQFVLNRIKKDHLLSSFKKLEDFLEKASEKQIELVEFQVKMP